MQVRIRQKGFKAKAIISYEQLVFYLIMRQKKGWNNNKKKITKSYKTYKKSIHIFFLENQLS